LRSRAPTEFLPRQLAGHPVEADVLIGLHIVIIYRLARFRTSPIWLHTQIIYLMTTSLDTI
jgi:hypothetical protein